MAGIRSAMAASLVGIANAGSYNCPGSGSLVHAWMEVTSTAIGVACSNVKTEIEARANKKGGWTDPHNGGIYSVLDSTGYPYVIKTQRTTNPAKSVGGKTYTDKQNFELTDVKGSQGTYNCQIKACSESQGTSVGDFSTNYCDIRNLFCGSADGCQTVFVDFDSIEDSYRSSIGAGHDFSKCIVKAEEATVAAADSFKCPDSSAALGHASMRVTAVADASCDKVAAEMGARASGLGGWTDPHNGGIYSVLSTSDNHIFTKRTTNPKTSVGGKVYTDKQIYTLTCHVEHTGHAGLDPHVDCGKCDINACSESQGTSLFDFSTNYCDIRNLYCGSADGCTAVVNDFSSSESSHSGSLGAGHDFTKCTVKESNHVTV